jgi:hypothetical protein
MELKGPTNSPRSAARIASIVVSFGIKGGGGSLLVTNDLQDNTLYIRTQCVYNERHAIEAYLMKTMQERKHETTKKAALSAND